jgi:hypothetical protein
MAVRTGRAPTARAPRSRTDRATGRRVDWAAPAKAAPPAPVVERRRIREVRLWSVARVSVCFYLCGLVVVLAAAVVLWLVASAVGVVGEVESFMDDLGFEGFQFLSGTLFRAGLLIGLAGVAILVVLTVSAAALYNLFADLVGGIEVTLTGGDPREGGAVEGDGRGGASGDGARRR